ncbi:MAG: hypothetical protein ABJ308_10895 [Halieaceae bacterium]
MLRKILIAISVLISIPVMLFLTAWLYPRPVDTTPPWVFASDGSELNYCDLPELDGSGLMANDIPRAYTPGCGYTQYPQPVLRGCTEPLPEGAQDIRGLWQSVGSKFPDHVERIEQCGDRVVVTTLGVIHDHTSTNASNDVGPMEIGPLTFCMRTSHATTAWENNRLHFKLFAKRTVVERYIDDGTYQWTHPRFGLIKMKRICTVPVHARSFDRSHAL